MVPTSCIQTAHAADYATPYMAIDLHASDDSGILLRLYCGQPLGKKPYARLVGLSFSVFSHQLCVTANLGNSLGIHPIRMEDLWESQTVGVIWTCGRPDGLGSNVGNPRE